ncbi:SagB/ThcOx family dehydrogenase [Oceanobacillus piezotolerans]|uniref:SagB/ThcOx family dehydrogenase n=1 Tax=Oceanobacillus piezotolerans TaxID=2448030 RepID=A0A498DHY8_9BACI|nr:SagB family peptide dehydrogenase [Oceanobacillus piezotolerans]RLL40714.1 SagB/ThcOx family dehydrogenase [Oceanobacillus piezotolerans]
MSLEEFLHNLHFNIDKANQPNWEVDWEDAPLAYKLYRGLPVVPLSTEVPLTLTGEEPPVKLDLNRVGHFLWYVFGFTQMSQSVIPMDATDQDSFPLQSYRRFAPSGGALYPNELYVYLKVEGLPDGVYHYDVAHHSLVCLRKGNFDSYLARALGNRCDISSCFGIAFVSTMFWKNFFKYNNFAYRLQGLDAGVLMGQLMEVAERFGFASGVYFQFLDTAINHLLGLSELEESVYSIIPLSVEATIWSANGKDQYKNIISEELKQELSAIQPKHFQRSLRVKEYPMITAMNEASKLNSTRSFRVIEERSIPERVERTETLPHINPMSYDLAEACRNRFSPDMDFVLGKVSQQQLSTLLQEATNSFSYRNDLDEAYRSNNPRVTIYSCLYNVEGISNGAYYYDSANHSLREICPGDHRLHLQAGMTLDNVNLLQVPLCLHVAGDKEFYKTELGYRGYRIQQMEAGMLVQRLLLAASTLGMGGHPLLGFEANLSDELYKMDQQGKTSLIQIPIGPYRPRPWLSGGLHS